MSIVNLFKESRARHYRWLGQRERAMISGMMQAHILYLSRIEIPAPVGNFGLKTLPQIFVFDWSKSPPYP